MTVRFKCQSEYQKSYGTRSRSASPQRCVPLAGLRSDHMAVSREPGLQRRRRRLAPPCSFMLRPSEPQHSTAHRKASSPAFRSRSAHRKHPSLDPKSPTPPESRVEPESPAAPGTPLAADRPGTPESPLPAADSGPAGKSTKLRPSQPDSQPQPSRPLTSAPDGRQTPVKKVDHALRWRAGLRSGGQRLGGHRSEYHNQFGWKEPPISASPILTAEQVLYSSSRSIPPFKKNAVAMETEYQRSFQGQAPPPGPRLMKHLEHQRLPLFHTHMTHNKRREESQKKPSPHTDGPTPRTKDATPPQVQGIHRMLTEYESSFRSPLYRIPEEGGATEGDAPQASELRRQASDYRLRAWGLNFCRDHLSQLRSNENALWEPSDSATHPPTPRPTSDPQREAGSNGTSCVEALDLASCSTNSSRRSSVVGSGEIHDANENSQLKAQTAPGPLPQRRTAWEQEEEEEEDEEEGRLTTPRLKMRPVQRTHHDLTTPAAGGAILVGKMDDESSPNKAQRCGSAVSMAAWSESNRPRRPSPGSSPDRKPAPKPIRAKQVLALHRATPPMHGIQGMLRSADFQHNGELGLRFRELQCSGCDSDEGDRLSVMSWRSASSCSVASAVLERAQKRRENFWGKK